MQPTYRSLRLLQLTSLLAAAAALIACGGNDEARPDGYSLGGATYIIPSDGPCEDGDSEVCSATIHQANGVKSCFRGVRSCVEGVWSACSEPPAESSD